MRTARNIEDGLGQTGRNGMKLGWKALNGVRADRVWLRPSGLISGRAAAEAIASGQKIGEPAAEKR